MATYKTITPARTFAELNSDQKAHVVEALTRLTYRAALQPTYAGPTTPLDRHRFNIADYIVGQPSFYIARGE